LGSKRKIIAITNPPAVKISPTLRPKIYNPINDLLKSMTEAKNMKNKSWINEFVFILLIIFIMTY
jgi:hypothetical protein